MFQLQGAEFRYEPYPIGLIRPALPDEHYERLLATWPPTELFMSLPKVGHKLVLSEKFHPKQYADYVRSTPPWRELHRYIKSPEFIGSILEMLKQHHVDLGYRHPARGLGRDLQRIGLDLRRGRWPRFDTRLRARFDYSMLPVDGGYISPHTDSPGKVITLVLTMGRKEEWPAEYGGSTDVVRLKDPTRSFNHLNAKCNFDEVEVLHSYPFDPNQLVVFVKTFNSWHSVGPLTGTGSGGMRRTCTINIEEDD